MEPISAELSPSLATVPFARSAVAAASAAMLAACAALSAMSRMAVSICSDPAAALTTLRLTWSAAYETFVDWSEALSAEVDNRPAVRRNLCEVALRVCTPDPTAKSAAAALSSMVFNARAISPNSSDRRAPTKRGRKLPAAAWLSTATACRTGRTTNTASRHAVSSPTTIPTTSAMIA